MNKNDIIIIMSFGYFGPEEVEDFKPKIVVANEKNGIKEVL